MQKIANVDITLLLGFFLALFILDSCNNTSSDDIDLNIKTSFINKDNNNNNTIDQIPNYLYENIPYWDEMEIGRASSKEEKFYIDNIKDVASVILKNIKVSGAESDLKDELVSENDKVYIESTDGIIKIYKNAKGDKFRLVSQHNKCDKNETAMSEEDAKENTQKIYGVRIRLDLISRGDQIAVSERGSGRLPGCGGPSFRL